MIHLLSIVMIVGFSVFSGIHSAAAYVLTGPHLLDLMIQKFGKADRLLVTQKLVLKHNSAEKGLIEFDETARYIFPDRFRSDTFSNALKRVHVYDGGSTLTIMDGRISSEPESGYDRYKDLLLYQSRRLLQNRLIRLGVDPEISSVGRFQNRLAYIIGAEYPDETRSQVWIDKASFKPIRWLLVRKEPTHTDNRSVLEFRYRTWRQTGSISYPMNIQIFQDDVLLREINAASLTVNPSFEAILFDIDFLMTQYEADLSENTKSDDMGMGEVQKTIQEFKKRYE